MAFEIAKAGWVQRLSSVLRRWKKNWLVLYHDGSLKYFESPDSHRAEEAVKLPMNCQAVYEGMQVVGDPPAGYGRTCMFSLALDNGPSQWTFCAESPDDMKAWTLALNEACQIAGPRYEPRTNRVYPSRNMAYPGHVISYPGQVHYGTHPPAYVLPQGQTVIYADSPYNRRRRDQNDALMGGMLLGGLMWGPLLWW